MTAKNLMKRLIILVALATAFVAPAWAEDASKATPQFNVEQTQEIEGIIHSYLLAHPEVITEAMQKLQEQEKQAEDQRLSDAAKGVKPVSAEDHIRGNVNAAVKVIEFSDFECPFCKGFHATMKQVMTVHEKDGKIAWVYRHFPLDQIHSKARKEAQAAECAAEQGGNKAFGLMPIGCSKSHRPTTGWIWRNSRSLQKTPASIKPNSRPALRVTSAVESMPRILRPTCRTRQRPAVQVHLTAW